MWLSYVSWKSATVLVEKQETIPSLNFRNLFAESGVFMGRHFYVAFFIHGERMCDIE